MKFNPILRHNYRIEHFAHTNQVVSSKKSPAFSLILCFAHSSTLSFLLKTHQFSGKWKTKWNSTFNEGKKRKFSLEKSRENLLIPCTHAFITCIFYRKRVSKFQTICRPSWNRNFLHERVYLSDSWTLFEVNPDFGGAKSKTFVLILRSNLPRSSAIVRRHFFYMQHSVIFFLLNRNSPEAKAK